MRNPAWEDDTLVLVVLDFGSLVMQNIRINSKSNNYLSPSLSYVKIVTCKKGFNLKVTILISNYISN